MKTNRPLSQLATIIGALAALALVACGGSSEGSRHQAHAGHQCPRGEHGGEASGDCPCQHGEGEHGHAEGEHGHGEHGHAEGEHGHGEHGAMPPTVASFHDVIRPIWHSEPGPGRSTRACTNVEQFRTHGQAIAAAPVPTGADETAWREAVTALNASIATLAERCPTGTEGHDTVVAEIHTRFHAVMERAGGGHH